MFDVFFLLIAIQKQKKFYFFNFKFLMMMINIIRTSETFSSQITIIIFFEVVLWNVFFKFMPPFVFVLIILFSSGISHHIFFGNCSKEAKVLITFASFKQLPIFGLNTVIISLFPLFFHSCSRSLRDTFGLSFSLSLSIFFFLSQVFKITVNESFFLYFYWILILK